MWSLLVLGVLASVAPGLQSINNQLLPVFQPSNSSAVFGNALAQSVVVNSTGENALTVQCSGAHYGVNVDMISCQAAFERIPDDSDSYSFMQRDRRTSRQHLPLPIRWLSRKILYPCLLSPQFQSGVLEALIQAHSEWGMRRSDCSHSTKYNSSCKPCPDTTSRTGHFDQVRRPQPADWWCSEQHWCVQERVMITNGISSELKIITGGDNHLAVVVTGTGYPNVHCNPGSAPSPRSVLSVLNNIYADINKRVFGPEGAPGVDEGLPYDLASCTLSPAVRSEGQESLQRVGLLLIL